MGLDMYAYTGRKGQYNEHWEQGEWDKKTNEFVSPVEKPRELAYWRKHPNLHGWMERLWVRKMNEANSVIPEDARGFSTFNGVELELTWEDIDELELAVKKRKLPATSGFFFGDDADQFYYENDLKFIQEARAELFCGLQVFYNSSW